MIDMSLVTSPQQVFTVWRREDGSTGGLAYTDELPISMILQVTDQVIPLGLPYIIMWRVNVPQDYEDNVEFIATLDWNNPDGLGGEQ